MVPQVIADHCGDEEIAVVVSVMVADCDFLTDIGTGFFQKMRMKLGFQERIGEALVDEYRRAGAAFAA